MCATEKDIPLSPGREAAKLFPGLAGPVMGALLVRQMLKNWFPKWLSATLMEPMKAMPDAAVAAGAAALALWAFAVDLITAYLTLGAFRLCLDRAEGRPGDMPWRIFGQWKRYLGWMLWSWVLTFGWVLGRQLLDTWVIYGFMPSSMRTDLYFTLKSYFNIVRTILSMLLFSLLVLSVRTAYLRAPERGFWRAVGFGLGEGFRKLPKTIGTQLKYVVSVYVAVTFLGALYRNLVHMLGGDPLSWVSSLPPLLLGVAAEAWTLVVYGCLAARCYDPPEGAEEGELPLMAQYTKALIGTPTSPFPSARKVKLVRRGPWYYWDNKRGPTRPGPLERK